jgi:hypothetical protein
MYEQLLKADVVVADLSTSNKNAYYELGIRHALRPYTTVVVAEDGIKTFPFDLNHVAVRQYHHLVEDIGFEEVMRFREALTQAIIEILKKNPRPGDSPVYTFLKAVNPPSIAAAVQAADQSAGGIGKNSESIKATAAPRPLLSRRKFGWMIQPVSRWKSSNRFLAALHWSISLPKFSLLRPVALGLM